MSFLGNLSRDLLAGLGFSFYVFLVDFSRNIYTHTPVLHVKWYKNEDIRKLYTHSCNDSR